MTTSDWTPTPHYPDLSRSSFISLDCETKDPNLMSLGPGAKRGDGYLVGVSIRAESFCAYYPIRHEGGGNLPKTKVVQWLKDVLSKGVPVIGANLMYDLQWLSTEGITVTGPKQDVIIREALINENQYSYSLEAIAKRYGLAGKEETRLVEAARLIGVKDKDIKSNLWRFHSNFVGPYAEQDAWLPWEIYKRQEEFIDKFGLQRVCQLESRLTDTLFRMWDRGIPIDEEAAERNSKALEQRYHAEIAKLKHVTGLYVDVWSGKSLQQAYEAKGIQYEKTPKGNPSFTADWLDSQTDELSQSILRARQFDRSGSVFIESKILRASVRGRIHPNYNQTKTEDGGGTKSGRLSSQNPNLQQVPARNPELSRLIRACFISDTGTYGVFDYSQQEPRVGVHFAFLRGFQGADVAVSKYRENPKTDYHELVADLCESITSIAIGRKAAKTINLGLAYGMGGAKLCRNLGLPTEFITIRGELVEVAGPEGKQILEAYNRAVPFVKILATDAANLAKRRGYVKTILGRRCNFPEGKFTHKAANRIIQGSSADMIKQALIDLDDAGYLPYNTVHDEVNNPIEDIKKDCAAIREIMLNAVPLEVPLLVDVEVGPTWGDCSEIAI